jgi:ADP-heptose:LPS heptosyltransferase
MLIVRDDRLGDLMLTLPAIDRLRRAYPETRIALLVAPSLVPLARLFTPIDEVLACGRDVAATAETIRHFQPHAAVCVSRRAAAARALRRAGVRRVTGTGRRWFSLLFDRRVEGSRRGSSRHELEHAMDIAARAGADVGAPAFPMTLPHLVVAETDAWLERNGIDVAPIVIHPGSGGSCPAWPAASWLRLAVALRASGYPLVVSGGPTECDLLEPFGTAGFPIFDHPLPELACLLRRSVLVLSNSTGPIHLAAALDRATLAIHAPWRSCGAERWGPYSRHGWALVVGRQGGRRWSRRRRRRWAARELARLPVEVVARAAGSMLAGASPRSETSSIAWPGSL